jgi:surface protein
MDKTINKSKIETQNIIKIRKEEELRDIILSGKFDDAIQIKNNEHICKDGTIYDYSEITSTSYMFNGYASLTTIPLFDTSNITDMSGMFAECYSLTTIPLFDTSNVTDMSFLFFSCSKLTFVPLLDTSNVTKMGSMFYYCISLPKLKQIKFLYQKDKLLLKSLELNPELFSEKKLDELLSGINND